MMRPYSCILHPAHAIACNLRLRIGPLGGDVIGQPFINAGVHFLGQANRGDFHIGGGKGAFGLVLAIVKQHLLHKDPCCQTAQ